MRWWKPVEQLCIEKMLDACSENATQVINEKAKHHFDVLTKRFASAISKTSSTGIADVDTADGVPLLDLYSSLLLCIRDYSRELITEDEVEVDKNETENQKLHQE